MMERLFTAYQVADILGRPRREVQGWIESGELASQRLDDGTVRISEKHLVRFLRRQGVDMEALMAQTLQAERQETSADERARLLSPDPPDPVDASPPPPKSPAEPLHPAPVTDNDTLQPRVAMAAHVAAALEADAPAPDEAPPADDSNRPENPYQSFTETINGSAATPPPDESPVEADSHEPDVPQTTAFRAAAAPEQRQDEPEDQPAVEPLVEPALAPDLPAPVETSQAEIAPEPAEAPSAEQPADDEGEPAPAGEAPEPVSEPVVEQPTPPAVEPVVPDRAPEPEPASVPDEPAVEETPEPVITPEPATVPSAEQPPADEDEPPAAEAPDETTDGDDEPASDEKPEPASPAAKIDRDSQAGQIVQAILSDAVKRRATAIRLEACGDRMTLRMRIGGELEERESFRRRLPAGAGPKVIDELMSLAGLDGLAAGPQQGRVETTVGRRVMELAVSAMPTVGGQEIVVQLGDPAIAAKGLTALGMTRKDAHAIEDMLDRRSGLIVVAAPPRHGRGQTLRAMTARLADGRRGVLAIERSVGSGIDNVAQCRCGGRGGMAWDEALWAAADHDCDVVAVEDICDPAAAAAAVEGALGGMTTLAGLWADSPVEAIHLLVRMGVAPWPLAATLQGVVAQRVVPTLCKDCRTPAKPARKDLSALGLKARDVDFETFTPRGCAACANTGYKGKTVLTSLLQIDQVLADVIRDGAEAEALAAAAERTETPDLLTAGLVRARKGRLALADLVRAGVGGE